MDFAEITYVNFAFNCHEFESGVKRFCMIYGELKTILSLELFTYDIYLVKWFDLAFPFWRTGYLLNSYRQSPIDLNNMDICYTLNFWELQLFLDGTLL
jgi:hypothetical protein